MENKFKFDHDKNVVDICGIKYSMEFFESLGVSGLPIGSKLQIVARKDGTVTLRTLDENGK